MVFVVDAGDFGADPVVVLGKYYPNGGSTAHCLSRDARVAC